LQGLSTQLSFKSRNELVLYGIFSSILLGLLFSRFLLSIGMIALLLHSILQNDLLAKLKLFTKAWPYLMLTGVFFLCAISYVNSENTPYFLDRMRIRLPFLILPISFYLNEYINVKNVYRILYTLLVLIFGICLILTIQYSLNPSYYNQLYEVGKTLPTPIHHIRFSLLVNIAIVGGLFINFKNIYLFHKYEKYFRLVMITFLIIFLHLLAVRSGLLALYPILLHTVIYYIVIKKKWIQGVVLLFMIPILGYIGYNHIPTIKNKVGYTLYSIDKFWAKDNIRDLSDSRRIGSILAGIDIGNKNPLTGVGIGDIQEETNKYLVENYPALKGLNLLPHNQYIYFYATMGIIGLIMFIVLTLGPILFYKAYLDYYFIALQLIGISSFMVEHTIETQLGTAIYLLFFLLSLNYLRLASLNHNKPANA